MTIFARILFVASLVLGGFAAQAQDEDYRIRPGDTLTIEILEDPSLNRTVTVLPNGQITFPYAGSVRASQRTISQVEAALRGGISSNFASPPNVFVTVSPTSKPTGTRSARKINVYFLGEIANPGMTSIKSGTTLLQAIAVGGGFSKFAATKRLQLRRTNPVTGVQSVTKVDYTALANGATLENEIELRDGDVILVPERRLFE
jgi:polysaccharide export outer membrane protein